MCSFWLRTGILRICWHREVIQHRATEAEQQIIEGKSLPGILIIPSIIPLRLTFLKLAISEIHGVLISKAGLVIGVVSSKLMYRARRERHVRVAFVDRDKAL